MKKKTPGGRVQEATVCLVDTRCYHLDLVATDSHRCFSPMDWAACHPDTIDQSNPLRVAEVASRLTKDWNGTGKKVTHWWRSPAQKEVASTNWVVFSSQLVERLLRDHSLLVKGSGKTVERYCYAACLQMCPF